VRNTEHEIAQLLYRTILRTSIEGRDNWYIRETFTECIATFGSRNIRVNSRVIVSEYKHAHQRNNANSQKFVTMAEKSSLTRLQSNEQLMMPNSESSHSTDTGLHGTDGMLKIGRFKFRGKTDNLPQFVTIRIIFQIRAY
jgi:hypothetical protein